MGSFTLICISYLTRELLTFFFLFARLGHLINTFLNSCFSRLFHLYSKAFSNLKHGLYTHTHTSKKYILRNSVLTSALLSNVSNLEDFLILQTVKIIAISFLKTGKWFPPFFPKYQVVRHAACGVRKPA